MLNYSDKEGWEQARMISYAIAQVNSKATFTPQSIMSFPWDTKPEKVEVTAEDTERLKKQADKIAKRLYG